MTKKERILFLYICKHLHLLGHLSIKFSFIENIMAVLYTSCFSLNKRSLKKLQQNIPSN